MNSTYKCLNSKKFFETTNLEAYMQDYFGRILRRLKELSDEKERNL